VKETADPGERFADDAGRVTMTYDIRDEEGETIGVGDLRLLVFRRPDDE
jgi:hypothetical protein